MIFSEKIQNLKCGGCANTIKSKLSDLKGVSHVDVNVEESIVNFNLESERLFQSVVQKLAKLGYPLEGEQNSLGNKAKSFVSCATGRMNA